MDQPAATRRSFLVSSLAAPAVAASPSPDQPFAAFSSEGKNTLTAVLSSGNFRGQIPPSAVAAFLQSEHTTRDALMLKLIAVARSFAHPPISRYFVGAVALGSSGTLYLGCNIEVPHNMLGLTVHGEQAAIANAFMSNEHAVEALTAGGAPCGHCRQFLSETSLETSLRLIMKDGSSVPLSQLLPQPFGPRNLGLSQGSFPVRRAALPALSDTPSLPMQEAWRAACTAYAPYSHSPSGVAIVTDKGRIFSGSYIENAAFNPSLPPLESALAGYFMAGPRAGNIQHAVLVEKQNAAVSHEVTTRIAIAALAPGAHFERVTLPA